MFLLILYVNEFKKAPVVDQHNCASLLSDGNNLN